MNKAIFWDFDGTLTMHRPLWTKSVHRALELAAPGCGITADDIRPHLQAGFTWHKPELDYTHLIGEAWWENLRLRFCAVYLDLGVDERCALEASAMVRELVLDTENYTLYDDAVPVLRACMAAGFRNYIVSNNFPELPEIVEKLGLSPFLSGCFVSALVGYEKPRRDIFEAALEAAGHPDICYIVGDNPIADIAGAQAAGIPAVLVHSRAESTADHVCDTLTDVLKIVIRS